MQDESTKDKVEELADRKDGGYSITISKSFSVNWDDCLVDFCNKLTNIFKKEKDNE